MRGGKRAGSGAKNGMKNAAKPAEARRDIDKSVSYSAAEWNIIEAALIATGQTHSAFARVATVAAANMNIGLRQSLHPEWVEELFQQMPLDLRDRIVKTAIQALVQPEGSGFRLHSFLQRKANRVPVLPTAQNVVAAFAIAEAWLAYESTEDKTSLKYRDEEQ